MSGGQIVPFRAFQAPIVEGRVPPHDLDAEAAVLSSALIDPAAFAKLDFLRPEHFYSERHRRIFEACGALAAAGTPIDIALVGGWLKERERLAQVGGMGYLTDVLNAAPAVRNVRHYGEIVHEHARVRGAILHAQRVAAQGYGDVGDRQAWLDGIVDDASANARANPRLRVQTHREVMRDVIAQMGEAVSQANAGVVLTGVSTGLATLDDALGGLRGGRIYTIVAMSGVGKTMLSEFIASHNAARGVGVVFALVADMTPHELADRQLARLARIDSRRIERARRMPMLSQEEWARLTPAVGEVAKWPFLAMTARGANVGDIVNRARRFADLGIESLLHPDVKRVPLGLLCVDYMQRLSPMPDMANRKKHEVMDHAAERMKRLAEELDIPIIQIAQAKNLTDGRTGKPIKPEPGAMVCAESSGLDRESDVVMYLHADKARTPDRRDLLVLKGRGGGEVAITLDVDAPFCRFVDPSAVRGW